MSVQIELLAPATRVASRKLGPTAGTLVARLAPEQAGGLRDEQVGEHVRQMRDARHQRGRGCRRRSRAGLRAEARQQAVQALVQHARGAAAGRGQVPDGALEQVRACVRRRPARLGAGERVAADEALVGARLGDRALGGADVADDAAGARRGAAPRATVSPSAPTGAATNTTSAPSHRAGHVRRRGVDRAELQRAGAHARGRGRSRKPRRPPARAPPGRSSRRSARRRGRRPSKRSLAPASSRTPGPGPSDGAERLPRQRRRALDRLCVLAKSSARSACGPSQIASSGLGCTSTMMPSAPTAAAASESGSTRSRRPAAWLGSTITGRCDELLEHRHGHQVEREAVGGLEGADAALAEHHVAGCPP